MDVLSLGISVFCITLLLVYLLRVPAVWTGWVDIPRGHKFHTGHVPLVGGLAMFLAMAMAIAVEQLAWPPHYAGFALGALVLLFTGLLDDRVDLSPRVKFFAQSLAALCLVWTGGPQLATLGDLLGSGEIALGGLALPLTLFAVIGLINAINFSDGLDGLAGGLVLIALTAFMLAASLAGHHPVVPLLVACLAAVAGFWVFNMRFHDQQRPYVFMGNAGSMLLGFALAWFSIDLTQGEQPFLAPIYAVWFLGLPIMETVSLIGRRIRQRRHPFQAGRDHLHHALLHAGLSHATSVWLILGAQAVLAAIGFACWRMGIPEAPMFLGFLLLFALYNLAVMNGWRIMAALKNRAAAGRCVS